MKKSYIVALTILFALILGAIWYFESNQNKPSRSQTTNEKVVINEAVRTLLYLPLYHAEYRGFFKDEKLDVEIISAGSATASFASMLSGEADFSQADPMYVPISRVEGSDAIVVAQVIARIAVWGVGSQKYKGEFNNDDLRDTTIATHPRPMTAYTYAVKALRDVDLKPDEDVKLLQVRPGGELAALLSGEADLAFTLEPGTSIAEDQGGKVLVSFPEILGDQIFTALMTTEANIKNRPEVIEKVMRAYQRSLAEISADPELASNTAKAYFPNVDELILDRALQRLVSEKVYSPSIAIPQHSWEKAVNERMKIGDLKEMYPYSDAVASDLINDIINPDAP